MRVIEVQEPWLELIRTGQKTVEGRVGPFGKFDEVLTEPGVNLLLQSDQQRVPATLANVVHYSDLNSYLEGEGWERVAPHTGSLEGARSAYLAIEMKDENGGVIQVFSPDRIKKLGGINALQISI